MAGRIPDETLETIRDRVSIVEVVSGYVALKKSGRGYLGLCPFHSEKTPSFTVNEERGLFHCFGCGAGGTVFTFLMRMDRLDFPEAVRVLAQRAGVDLPETSGPGDGGHRRALFAVNDAAQESFRRFLRGSEGTAARRYLERRGLTAGTIERYGVGFCPPTGTALLRALAAKRVSARQAVELGLIGQRSGGGYYDRFRGRITFPIRDGGGRLLGFGGRILGSDHPKYLNSPESPLFHKGQVLYGLYEARQTIREMDRVVIVEGYMDALALVEAGIGYAVAGLGTALTAPQLRLARRFAAEVVAFFDGDRAGQEAATRAFAVCAETGIWGLGAFLPEGTDPDSFVREKGVEETTALLERAEPLVDFFLRRVDPGANASLPERGRAVQRFGEVIARVRDPVQFSLLARTAAQRLGVDEAVFWELRTAPSHSRPTPKAAVPERPAVLRREETALLEAMALNPDVGQLVQTSGVLEAFESAELAEAGRAILEAREGDRGVEAVVDRLPQPIAERVSAAMLGQGPMADADCGQVARDCIARIEGRRRRSKIRSLQAELRDAESSGDDARYRKRLEESNALLRRKESGYE
jgi:DNA primase